MITIVWHFELESSPLSHVFECLLSKKWGYLKELGGVGGSVSLEMAHQS